MFCRKRGCCKCRPVRVRAGKIVFGIDTAFRHALECRNSNRESMGEWPKLLEALDELERMRRKRHPPHERIPRVGIHADMLPHVRRE
jgi:hypothetical protein